MSGYNSMQQQNNFVPDEAIQFLHIVCNHFSEPIAYTIHTFIWLFLLILSVSGWGAAWASPYILIGFVKYVFGVVPNFILTIWLPIVATFTALANFVSNGCATINSVLIYCAKTRPACANCLIQMGCISCIWPGLEDVLCEIRRICKEEECQDVEYKTPSVRPQQQQTWRSLPQATKSASGPMKVVYTKPRQRPLISKYQRSDTVNNTSNVTFIDSDNFSDI